VQSDSLTGSFKSEAPLEVGNASLGKAFSGGIDDLRLYNRALEAAEIEQLAIEYPARAILSGNFGKRTKDDDAKLREYFLAQAAPQDLPPAGDRSEEPQAREGTAEQRSSDRHGHVGA
jgi:hypothetical protein